MFCNNKTKSTVLALTLIIGSIGLYFSGGNAYFLTAIDPSNVLDHLHLEQQQKNTNTNADRKVNKSWTSLNDALSPSSKKIHPVGRKITGYELLLNNFSSSDRKSIEYDIMNMVIYQTDVTINNIGNELYIIFFTV